MTYIEKLAADLLRRFGTDLSRIAVVFPNKRASLFLNKELARQAAAISGDNKGVLWSPAYITISDLFRRHSDLQVADQIMLVCRLYDVFMRCTGFEGESLDHFYNWGVLLLSDFDDLDKNMADASQVFSLVRDLRELDDVSYLTPTQREALKEFFTSFSDDHPSLLRKKFLQLWDRLYDIYETFRNELRDDKMAYEGMLYRDVCEQSETDFEYDCYCFVGFNMLQQVEQHLFTRLKRSGKALFYWDYDRYYLNNNHEAGHFISDYLLRFPDAMPKDSTEESFYTSPDSKLTYISATTENLQGRYVHDWLLEKDRWKAGPRTAIVMSDEHLLQTIIRSLPEEVESVNITAGYPLSQSPVVSLLQLLIEMHVEGRILGTSKYRLKYVNRVLRHPFAKHISPNAMPLCKSLNDSHKYYPSRQELCATFPDEGLDLLFIDLDTISQPRESARLFAWLMQLVLHIARDSGLTALDAEALYRTHQVLQRLFTLIADDVLTADITTCRRLLMQIVSTTTVPYHGEPIAGIQIMGVLETRCLDFDHVLLLSCNEGNMPKGVNDSSFIPHSVRLAHGMTTVEHKVGIYSYYFHRLLQRAQDVTLTYNSSTEGINIGEMSRFMLQLMVESGLTISQRNLQAGQETSTSRPSPIVKDKVVMQRLYDLYTRPIDAEGRQKRISPSSLGVYLRCQLRYYYQHVLGISELQEDTDEMDNKMFGNIFHKAAELAYRAMQDRQGWVYADVIKRTVGDDLLIESFVDQAFREELFKIKDHNTAFTPEYNGLQLINRNVILALLKQLLRYDLNDAPIQIRGLERHVSMHINLDATDLDGNAVTLPLTIGGIIDRLDMVKDTIRVIDYKTGFNTQGAMADVSAIFQPENIGRHSDYYLQTMLYSYIVRHSRALNPTSLPVSPALLFVQKTRTDGYTPVLSIADRQISDIKDVEPEYIAALTQLIRDIMNPQLPFAPTENADSCKHCPFLSICGI